MPTTYQITMSDEEDNVLSTKSRAGGYPNNTEYIKAASLGYETTYSGLYRKITAEMLKKPIGSDFYLRDTGIIIPPLVGRWIYDAVIAGKVPGIEHLKKTQKRAPERYRRVNEPVEEKGVANE